MVEPESETATIHCKEYEILTKNYTKLISTLTDIDNLLSHCVENRIIEFREEDTLASKGLSDKIKSLLLHISGPLEAGDSKRFYKLLDIMKSKGKQPTKDLALIMEKSLNG